MTHIEILRIYNRWRQDIGDGRTLEDYGITPCMIGEALDAVIKDAERYQWLCDGNGYFMEEEMLCHMVNEKEKADKAIDAAIATESRQ